MLAEDEPAGLFNTVLPQDDLLRHDVGAAVEESKELLDPMVGGPDYREGVAARREKRLPRF